MNECSQKADIRVWKKGKQKPSKSNGRRPDQRTHFGLDLLRNPFDGAPHSRQSREHARLLVHQTCDRDIACYRTWIVSVGGSARLLALGQLDLSEGSKGRLFSWQASLYSRSTLLAPPHRDAPDVKHSAKCGSRDRASAMQIGCAGGLGLVLGDRKAVS
ncbi:hypothetical protein LIA77_04578 [Sarocladium implicatum]|nr:hypothetical protein LIA77_04578 [Sarocladium implicatum]